MASVTPDQDVDSSGPAVTDNDPSSMFLHLPRGTANKWQEMEEKWKRLRTLNNDLQEALEKSDIEVQELTQELESLHEENRSLQKEKAKFLDLMDEADKLKLSLEHCKYAECTAKHGKKELVSGQERNCPQMEEKADQLLHQISVSEEENHLLCDDVNKLKQQVMELERYLDRKNLELSEKDKHSQEIDSVIEEMTMTMNQYSSIKEVLNNKIQELQSQLEESYQEIAMRNAFEENGLINNPEASGTIMYEIIQTKLEKQLEQTHMAKQCQGIQGFLGLRLLLNIMVQFLWCCFSVGFVFFLFFLLIRLYHTLHPDYLLLDLRRVFSAQTFEVIQNLLHPFMKMRELGLVPS
ncbi:uncharacterized protein LOC142741555 [Rhinoderma darwinii]|uniref:uncharacterized protein LOC142741555 n=1 Tax=Rhinoderma darwinii TaxID=43563 RepID=UPI003F66B066